MPVTTPERAKAPSPRVDFDQWSALARSDPAAFEARRTQAVEQLIQGAPAHRQQRLRCLQWRIDHIRARANSPMAACIKLNEMMWDSLVGPGGLRDALEGAAEGELEPPTSAKVLEFERAP